MAGQACRFHHGKGIVDRVDLAAACRRRARATRRGPIGLGLGLGYRCCTVHVAHAHTVAVQVSYASVHRPIQVQFLSAEQCYTAP